MLPGGTRETSEHRSDAVQRQMVVHDRTRLTGRVASHANACDAVIFALRRVILLRSYIRLAASYIATQLYSPCGELYCYAVVFGRRRVVFASRVCGGEYNNTAERSVAISLLRSKNNTPIVVRYNTYSQKVFS